MIITLPSNVYKDIKADPYLAPTLPADPVRNNLTEEQQKKLAELECQLAGLKKMLTSYESYLARIAKPYSFGPEETIIRTAISVLSSAIEATTMMIEKFKSDANPNASAT